MNCWPALSRRTESEKASCSQLSQSQAARQNISKEQSVVLPLTMLWANYVVSVHTTHTPMLTSDAEVLQYMTGFTDFARTLVSERVVASDTGFVKPATPNRHAKNVRRYKSQISA
jgi:hypothetical protein